ncbi:MAG: Threonine dehydrogenase and related Zn-dependent dehydrogenases, partial [uncultured Gemmatimonadaceae bacterium]
GQEEGGGARGAGPADPESARLHREDHEHRDLRLRPAPLQRLHPDDGEGRHPRPRVHGRGGGGGARREEPQGGRPRRRPLPDRVRQLQRVPRRGVLAVRELQPERAPPRGALRPLDVRHLRLLAPHRRLRRRAGRVRAGAVRRRGAAQDRERLHRRAGALPVGHPPHRLHGRGDVRHPARRRDRGLGRGAGRAVRDRERPHARRRAGDRDRPVPVPAGHGARPGRRHRRDQLRAARRHLGGRGAQGAHRRARPRQVHRRGGARGAHPRPALRLRPRQAGDDARDRPADRGPRGDHGVPERGHGLGDRRLRGLRRQVPDGLPDEPLDHDQERADPRAPLHEAAAGAHPPRRDRPHLRDHAHPPAAGRREGLRHLREQAGQLREGGAEGV